VQTASINYLLITQDSARPFGATASRLWTAW